MSKNCMSCQYEPKWKPAACGGYGYGDCRFPLPFGIEFDRSCVDDPEAGHNQDGYCSAWTPKNQGASDMIVKEADAGKYACCNASVPARCVGARCMAWQWTTKLDEDAAKEDRVVEIKEIYGRCGLTK